MMSDDPFSTYRSLCSGHSGKDNSFLAETFSVIPFLQRISESLNDLFKEASFPPYFKFEACLSRKKHRLVILLRDTCGISESGYLVLRLDLNRTMHVREAQAAKTLELPNRGVFRAEGKVLWNPSIPVYWLLQDYIPGYSLQGYARHNRLFLIPQLMPQLFTLHQHRPIEGPCLRTESAWRYLIDLPLLHYRLAPKSYRSDWALLKLAFAEIQRQRKYCLFARSYIHGDLKPAHILLFRGQFKSLIDWQEFNRGDFLYDYAKLITYYPVAQHQVLLRMFQHYLSGTGLNIADMQVRLKTYILSLSAYKLMRYQQMNDLSYYKFHRRWFHDALTLWVHL